MRTNITYIREKLIPALRSGNYKQTQGRLKKGDSLCCLGVFCDLYAEDHPQWSWDHDIFTNGTYEFDQVLPEELAVFIGLTANGSAMKSDYTYFHYENPIDDKHEHQVTALSALNDTLNKSFDEIADALERLCSYAERQPLEG